MVRSQSVCAGGQAFSVNWRPPRSSDIVSETSGVAEDRAELLEIERAAGGERARQVLVADEDGAEACRIAENVIGMFMRVDDIENRLVGEVADGGEETPADRDAAAGVDDGDAARANHQADVGDVALVDRVGVRDGALMGVNAGRDLLQCKIVARRGGRLLAPDKRVAKEKNESRPAR